MTFAQPNALWLTLLAPIALLLAALFWQGYLRNLNAWAKIGVWERLGIDFRKRHLRTSVICLTLAILGVALTLARPRWGTSEQTVERQGVDVVFVLDSSMSMAAQDVAPSRLDISKTLVRRLAGALPGHRVALVQAEGEGLVLAPLTVDSAVLDLLLDTIGPGSLPRPGTQLGPALQESLKLYPPDGEKHRTLVLISDGEDHGSGWEQSLQALKDAGVVVHALGVGTTRGSPIPLLDEDNRFKQDAEGRVVVTKVNEAVLERLAAETGGIYIAVSKPGTDPARITQAISAMEQRSFESESLEVLAERFQWPLTLAALALVLHLFVSPLQPRRSGREELG
ncbi:MAG: VWA domain-containing protein [bacterium]|nr:VWA domain-containing protein [bacterium]